MGFELVREMRKRKLPPNEKSVWLALGDHAHDENGSGAFPSQELLAQETGYSSRQVRNILRKLERDGWIVETKRPGRRTSREYRIILNPPVRLRAIDGKLRPEKISALEPDNPPVGAESVESKTGNLCNQDRKSLHQDRKSATVKTGRDFRLTPQLTPQRTPREEPLNARARESRDVGEASEPARGTTPKPSPSPEPEERLTPEERERQRIEKREANRAKARRDYADILRREREEQERKQARISLGNGTSQVHAPPDKYAESGR